VTKAAVVNHRLDLAVRLIDTVAGFTVRSAVSAEIAGKTVNPRITPDGNILFIGSGQQPEDFQLTLKARGYEPKVLDVKFAEMNPNMPYIETYVIPGNRYMPGFQCISFQGKMPGITGIDAVKIMDSVCRIEDIDSKNAVFTVSNPHSLCLDNVFYAAVNDDFSGYTPLEITEVISSKRFKVRNVPEHVRLKSIVMPRVMGKTESGKYLLRLRQETADTVWLVRFVTKKSVTFRKMSAQQLMPESAAVR
jgi:hypothetical protein